MSSVPAKAPAAYPTAAVHYLSTNGRASCCGLSVVACPPAPEHADIPFDVLITFVRCRSGSGGRPRRPARPAPMAGTHLSATLRVE
jgi:hypothetical protein